MDYDTKSVLQDWRNGGPLEAQYFAEAGKTVCSVGMNGRNAHPAQCFDIDTGKRIAEFRGFAGGAPASVSSHASRVVLSDIRLVRGVTEESDLDTDKNRVVWDYRTNKQVAEWVPATQANEYYSPSGLRTIKRWSPCAISPTGRYLAEGSNGILRIYELP
jgi:hypothetical protein